MKKKKWVKFLELIHKKRIGSKIERRELVNKSYYNRYTTIDNYRSLLTKLEILETISPGVYIKRKKVDVTWKLKFVRDMADSGCWKSWFIQL